MNIETDITMPGAPPPKREPKYERFLCLNGEFEGRGLIVADPEPDTIVAGYTLIRLDDLAGTHVAINLLTP